jgi:ATP-grasp ribosomal peptide maturase
VVDESPVLVLTQPFDPTADYVVDALHRRGTPVFRCDPGDFPQRLVMTAMLGGGWTGSLRLAERELRLENVRCAYYRRPTMFELPSQMSGPERRWAGREARIGFGGVVAALPRWLNHPHHLAYAEYKPVQLAQAVACGLRVPATIITNDPVEALRFARDAGQVVYKPLAAGSITEEDSHRFVFTTVLDDLPDADAVAHTAHLFQHWVPKQYEARVTAVDETLFAARIEAHSDAARTDWRTDYDHVSYTPIDVPRPVGLAALALMQRLRLRFGALDFIVTPGGDWTFLEVNPNGQWAWIEDATGQPIADAIAAALSEESR